MVKGDGSEGFLKILLTPDPGLAIVRFWQGVVDVVLRVLCIIVAIGVLVTASFTIIELRSEAARTTFAQIEKRRLNTIGAAGWLVVVSSVAIVLELLIVIVRFCNCDFVRSYRTPLVIDIFISVGVAAGILSGSIALAVFASEWADTLTTVITNAELIFKWTASTAGVGVGTSLVFFILALWSALFILNQWNKKVIKYTERL